MPSDRDFDPSVHLCVGDIAIDDPAQPSMLRVTIKQSKTDPFRKGVQLFVGRTSSPLCLVAAVLDYLTVRGTEPGPLFRYQDGRLIADEATVRECGTGQFNACRRGPVAVLHPQLQNRGGDYGSGKGGRGCSHQNPRPLGEPGIPAVCPDSARAPGGYISRCLAE